MRIFYFEIEGNYRVTPGDYVFYKLDDHSSVLRQVENNVYTLTGVYENDKDLLTNVINTNDPNGESLESLVTKSELLNAISTYRTQSTTHAFWNYALTYSDTNALPENPGLYVLPASVVDANSKLPSQKVSGLNALLRVTEYGVDQVILEFIQLERTDGGNRRYAICQYTKGLQGNVTSGSWATVLLNYDGNTIASLSNSLSEKINYLNDNLSNKMEPSLVMNSPGGTNEVIVSFNDGTFVNKGLIITYGSLVPNLGYELNTLTLKNLSSNQGQIYNNSALGLNISEIPNESGIRDILIKSNNTNTCLIYNVYKIDII